MRRLEELVMFLLAGVFQYKDPVIKGYRVDINQRIAKLPPIDKPPPRSQEV